MRAVVYTEYGPPEVLHITEVDKPTPKNNEILIRVYATPVNYGDITARNFANIRPREFNMPMPLWLPARIAFGLGKPRNPILGSELAGEIEATGRDVKKITAGSDPSGELLFKFEEPDLVLELLVFDFDHNGEENPLPIAVPRNICRNYPLPCVLLISWGIEVGKLLFIPAISIHQPELPPCPLPPQLILFTCLKSMRREIGDLLAIR